MKLRQLSMSTFILVLSFLVLACGQERDKWQGTIEEVDGVTVVKNPIEPISPDSTVTFSEEITIGEEEDSAEYLFNTIAKFNVDDSGNIFILDRKPQCVKLFDKTGKYLRTIGKEGQGPGEFQAPDTLLFTGKKELIVKDFIKGALIFFSYDGQFIKEVKHQIFMRSGHCIIDSQDCIYVEKFLNNGQTKLMKTLPPYEEFVEITSYERPARRSVPPPQMRFALLPTDNLIWGISSKYEFYILNINGQLVTKIEKEQSPVPMTEDYKSKYFEVLPSGIPRESQNFDEHFPAFDFIFTDGTGHIFVKTYEKSNTSEAFMIDVFNTDGQFLTRTELKVRDEISLFQDKFIVKNNKLYSKGLTEEGFPVLRRYGIIWTHENVS